MANWAKEACTAILHGYSGSRTVLTYISGLFAFLIAFLTVANIITRAGFSFQITAAYEVSENGLVLIAFFAIAYTHFTNKNIRVEVLLTRVSKRTASWLNLSAHILMLVVTALLVWGSWSFFWSSWQVREPMIGAGIKNVPIYPIKLIIRPSKPLIRPLIGEPLPSTAINEMPMSIIKTMSAV